MAGLETILSNSFRLPTPQQGSNQQQQYAQPNASGIGSPLEGIQAIGDVGKAYYKNWADIQSFASEMNSAGIDVTKPDWRSQEAVDAHDLYKKMLANAQYQGQYLKNSQKMMEKFTASKLSAHGQDIRYGGDLTNAPFDINQVDNTGMTSQAKDDAIQGRFDVGQANLMERQENAAASADARTQAQISAGNTRAANTNARITEQGALSRDLTLEINKIKDDRAKSKLTETIAPYKSLYENFGKLAAGDIDWKVSTKTNDSGGVMYEAPFLTGSKMGEYEDVDAKGKVTTKKRIVRGALLDPETGVISIEFEHGATQEFDQDQIESSLAQYAESNRGYKASDAQKFIGLLENADAEIERVPLNVSIAEKAKAIDIAAQEDLALFKSMNRVGAAKEFTLSDGTIIEIDREAGGMGLGKSYIRVRGLEGSGISPDTKYTPSQAVKILHEAGYYNDGAVTPKESGTDSAGTNIKQSTGKKKAF